MKFSVWAPEAKQVELVLYQKDGKTEDKRFPLLKDEMGIFDGDTIKVCTPQAPLHTHSSLHHSLLNHYYHFIFTTCHFTIHHPSIQAFTISCSHHHIMFSSPSRAPVLQHSNLSLNNRKHPLDLSTNMSLMAKDPSLILPRASSQMVFMGVHKWLIMLHSNGLMTRGLGLPNWSKLSSTSCMSVCSVEGIRFVR